MKTTCYMFTWLSIAFLVVELVFRWLLWFVGQSLDVWWSNCNRFSHRRATRWHRSLTSSNRWPDWHSGLSRGFFSLSFFLGDFFGDFCLVDYILSLFSNSNKHTWPSSDSRWKRLPLLRKWFWTWRIAGPSSNSRLVKLYVTWLSGASGFFAVKIRVCSIFNSSSVSSTWSNGYKKIVLVDCKWSARFLPWWQVCFGQPSFRIHPEDYRLFE